MYKKLLGVLLLSGVAIVSCSSSKSVFFEEGVTQNSIKDPFYVIPIDNRWVTEGMATNLPSQLKSMFYDQLPQAISSATPVPFETADQSEAEYEGSFKLAKLPTGKGVLEVYVASEEVLQSIQNRYILFLENYEFTVKVNPISSGTYAGMDTENTRTITFVSEFYVWDNQEKKAISWGTVKEESVVRESPTEEHYRELLTKSAAALLKDSPISVYP